MRKILVLQIVLLLSLIGHYHHKKRRVMRYRALSLAYLVRCGHALCLFIQNYYWK